MKKLLSLAVTVFLLCGMIVNVSAVGYGEEQKFSDVPENHWAFTYVQEMVRRGVINGYADGTFKPDNHVTRAEAAKMIAKIEGLLNNDIALTFDDVDKDAWYAKAIAGTQKYFNADNRGGEHNFYPNNYARRDDIFVALIKQKYGGIPVLSRSEEIKKNYVDIWETEEYKIPYIIAAIEKGIANGYYHETHGVYTIVPYAHITRAEFATLLYKLYYCVDVSDKLHSFATTPSQCSLEEFIQRYNQALKDNYDKIDWDGKEKISVIAMELDIDMLQERPIEEEKGVPDSFKNLSMYKNAASTFFVDKSNNLKGLYMDYLEIEGFDYFSMKDNLNKKEYRNSITLPKYRHICAIMALHNVSYEEALKILNVVMFTEGANRIYNGFYVAVDGDSIDMYENSYYFNHSSVGIQLPKQDNTRLDTLGLTIEEFIDRYNFQVYENFKYITADCRYTSPYDYIINKNNILSYRSDDGNFITYYIVLNYSSVSKPYIDIVCNNKNEVLSIRVDAFRSVNRNSSELDIGNLRSICALMAIVEQNMDVAIDRYFSTEKTVETSSGNKVFRFIDSPISEFYINSKDYHKFKYQN